MPVKPQIRIVADTREPFHISAYLEALGAIVERRMIDPGDYIVANDCAVERKTLQDFVNSLFQGRLLEQIGALREYYRLPFLLIEGGTEELSLRKNPRSFWGALLKAQLEHGIHVLATSDAQQTADAIYTLARRLQTSPESAPQARRRLRTTDLIDWQRYVVEGLPGVGPKTAEKLLAQFGSIRGVFAATASALQAVEGMGPVKAARIEGLIAAPFEPKQSEES